MDILGCVPSKTDGCAMYRGYGPMSELHKADRDLSFKIIEPFDLRTCKGFDVVFMQRPDNPESNKVFRICKQLKMKVVLDYDDDLTDVPIHNPYHAMMKAQFIDYKKYVKSFLKDADLIFVSTEALKKSLCQYGDEEKFVVINNCIDDYIYDVNEKWNPCKIVFWRGSVSHEQDLNVFKNELIELVKNNPDFLFMFCGDIFPDWLTELKVENLKFKETVNVFQFMFDFKAIKPCLTIVPLEDTGFNRCKSDIARIEATASGSLSLCPEWEEWIWNSDKRYLYNGKEEFFTKANQILQRVRKGEDLNPDFIEFRKYLIENKMLSNANKTRAECIKKLIGGKNV